METTMHKLTTIIPDNAAVLEIARMAVASHLHLITDGKRSVLSPIVPAGWKLQLDCESRKAQQLAAVTA